MPGPVVKSRRFPGLDRLPELAQVLIEAAFPPDDVMPTVGAGLTSKAKNVKDYGRFLAGLKRPSSSPVVTPPTISEMISRPPAGILPSTLRPLPHTITPQSVVNDAVDDLIWPPKGFINADPASQEMVHLLRRLPGETDPAKLAGIDRVTRHRPPMEAEINAPKGFYFGQKQVYGHKPSRFEGASYTVPLSRDPLINEMVSRYRKFDQGQRALRVHRSGGTPPPRGSR